MSPYQQLIGLTATLLLIAGPLLLGLAGFLRARRAPPDPTPTPWNWQLTINSSLLCALAFNLTFLIQEFFLVVPKALTPGLRPTLFHNNHKWEGDNPLASLLQGTGALSTLLTAVASAVLLRRRTPRSTTMRLFLIWMTYNGFLQSLPQFVVGAINPQNDVGMAMTYLGLGATTRTVVALLALAAIPVVALCLRRPLLSLAAETPTRRSNARAQSRLMFRVATLPALAAILLIIPFRVPREWIEVVMVPVVVTVIGVAWLQAGAWRVGGVKSEVKSPAESIALPLCALLILFLIFQLLLRPGIRFY